MEAAVDFKAIDRLVVALPAPARGNHAFIGYPAS